jgi:hypothetical protein
VPTDREYFARRAREERKAATAAVDANVRRVHLEMAAAYEKHAGIEPQECAREKRPSEQVS